MLTYAFPLLSSVWVLVFWGVFLRDKGAGAQAGAGAGALGTERRSD